MKHAYHPVESFFSSINLFLLHYNYQQGDGMELDFLYKWWEYFSFSELKDFFSRQKDLLQPVS
jgi:hypothetical protein